MNVRWARCLAKESVVLSTLMAIAALLLLGCSNNNPGEIGQGALVGGAAGAGTGALIGAAADEPGAGALIGGASGALVGAAVDASADRKQALTAEQLRVLEHQRKELSRQKREMQDVIRQEYYDKKLEPYMEPGSGAKHGKEPVLP